MLDVLLGIRLFEIVCEATEALALAVIATVVVWEALPHKKKRRRK